MKWKYGKKRNEIKEMKEGEMMKYGVNNDNNEQWNMSNMKE